MKPLLRCLFLLAPLLVLSGCLDYREEMTLKPDGSGEVRVVYGMDGNMRLDTVKARGMREQVARLPGLRWVRTVDTTEQERWYGGVLTFDAVTSLEPLSQVLPLKGMFQAPSLTDSAGVKTLRREVKLMPKLSGPELPMPGPERTYVTQICWTVPGRVVASDSAGRWENGTDRVCWSLPTDGEHGESMLLDVRWIPCSPAERQRYVDSLHQASLSAGASATGAESVSGNGGMPWAWIGGGLGLAVLLGGAVLVRRRKA